MPLVVIAIIILAIWIGAYFGTIQFFLETFDTTDQVDAWLIMCAWSAVLMGVVAMSRYFYACHFQYSSMRPYRWPDRFTHTHHVSVRNRSFDFGFRQMKKGHYRAYILQEQHYSDDIRSYGISHRQPDFFRMCNYICFTNQPYSLDEAQRLSEEWAVFTELLTRLGRTPSDHQYRLAYEEFSSPPTENAPATSVFYTVCVEDMEFKFEIKTVNGELRSYILSNHNYGRAPSDAHNSHRWFDSNLRKHYCCFKVPPSNIETAKQLTDAWCMYTEFLIRNRRTPEDAEFAAAFEMEPA